MADVTTKQRNVIKLSEWTSKVSNTVESELREVLKQVITENPKWGWEQISIQDVFAYAMNQLPPIYSEKGTTPNIKLEKSEMKNAIKKAMEKIAENPIHIGAGP